MENLKQTIINEMTDVFGDDTKRINHALKVLDYAQQIQLTEGGDEQVVIPAAILHDIGIHKAQEKYNSCAGKYQEIEGPPIARPILQRHNLPPEKIEHICKIIAHHHNGRDIDTIEFRIIWDADWLVNIPDEYPNANKNKLKQLIERVFKTQTGKKLAVLL